MRLYPSILALALLASTSVLHAEAPQPPAQCQADQTASLKIVATTNGQPYAGAALVAVMVGPGGEFVHGGKRYRAKAGDDGVAKFERMYAEKYLVATEGEYDLWERGHLEFHPPMRIAEVEAAGTTLTAEFGVANCAWCEIELEADPDVNSVDARLRPLTVGARKRDAFATAPKSGPIVLKFSHVPAGRWELEIRRSIKNAGDAERAFRREIEFTAGPAQLVKLKLSAFKLAGSIALPKDALGDSCELRLLEPQTGVTPLPGLGLPGGTPLTANKGKFDFGLLPQGEYMLLAKCVTKDKALHAYAFVSLEKDISNFKISFPSKHGDLKVKVTASTSDVAGVGTVRLLDAAGKTQVPAVAEFVSGKSSSDGALVFRTMPVGAYVVELSGAGLLTTTAKVEVKAGKPCECTVTSRSATVVRIKPPDFSGSILRLSWVYEDATGKALPISMRAELSILDSMESNECIGRGVPETAVRIRLMLDGYEDVTVPLDGKAGTWVEVTPKFERKK